MSGIVSLRTRSHRGSKLGHSSAKQGDTVVLLISIHPAEIFQKIAFWESSFPQLCLRNANSTRLCKVNAEIVIFFSFARDFFWHNFHVLRPTPIYFTLIIRVNDEVYPEYLVINLHRANCWQRGQAPREPIRDSKLDHSIAKQAVETAPSRLFSVARIFHRVFTESRISVKNRENCHRI